MFFCIARTLIVLLQERSVQGAASLAVTLESERDVVLACSR